MEYSNYSFKTHVLGTQKNRLDETVLLSPQNKCSSSWVRKYPQFYAHNFFLFFFSALYGWLFTDNPEAAFANYRLWESVGFIMAFGYSSFQCTDVKIYICMGFLTVGMILYGVVEVIHRRGSSNSFDIPRH